MQQSRPLEQSGPIIFLHCKWFSGSGSVVYSLLDTAAQQLC